MEDSKQIRKMILTFSPSFLEMYQKVGFSGKFKYCLYEVTDLLWD